MPLGTLVQLRRPSWPNPEESIGRAFGQIPKTKLSYWQITGPALVAYETLLPEILEVLAEKQGRIPNSDFVWFSPYMVGPSPATAVPYIMFTSSVRSQRRKAMNHIKNSKILQEHPGMRVGEWADAPHIGRQEQMGSSERSVYGKLEDPRSITADGFICIGSQVSALISFHYSDRTVKATASVRVEIDGTYHYLVPSHVLIPPRPTWETKTETEALEDSDDDEGFDFGDTMGDEEGLGEDDHLVTSLVSISSRCSESEDSGEQSLDNHSPDSAVKSDPAASTPTINAQSALKLEFSGIGEHDAHGDERRPSSNILTASIDLDYALCPVVHSDTNMSSRSMRLPDLPLMSGNFVEPAEDGTEVQVLTLHGRLTGRLFQTGAYVHLPNSSSYQQVYVAHFDSPVLPGDCGVMVYDTAGEKMFGHIVSGSATPARQSAFVIPAKHVHDDITRQMEMAHQIATCQKGSPRPALASGSRLSPDAALYQDNLLRGPNQFASSPATASGTFGLSIHEGTKMERKEEISTPSPPCGEDTKMEIKEEIIKPSPPWGDYRGDMANAVQGLPESESAMRHEVYHPDNDGRGRGRKRRKVYYDSEDDNIEGGEPRTNQPNTSGPLQEDGVQQFACPFYKHDPVTHRLCLFRETLTRTKYVKQHLRRYHLPPIHCPTCGELFNLQSALDDHIRERGCEKREFTHPGLTWMEQEALKRVPWDGRPSEQWYKLWDIIFPDITRPASPYVSDPWIEVVQNSLDLWTERGGPERMRDGGIFDLSVSGQPTSYAQDVQVPDEAWRAVRSDMVHSAEQLIRSTPKPEHDDAWKFDWQSLPEPFRLSSPSTTKFEAQKRASSRARQAGDRAMFGQMFGHKRATGYRYGSTHEPGVQGGMKAMGGSGEDQKGTPGGVQAVFPVGVPRFVQAQVDEDFEHLDKPAFFR